MKVKLNTDELRAAVADWLKKTMPELIAPDARGGDDAGAPHLRIEAIDAYPPSVTVEVSFVVQATPPTTPDTAR